MISFQLSKQKRRIKMKKFCKFLLTFLFIISASVLFSACDDEIVLVSGIDFYDTEIYSSVNDTIDLSYKIYPINSTNKAVTFVSTDKSVAQVDQKGKVSVVGDGQATIIIRTVDGGFEDHCKIITYVDPDNIGWNTEDAVVSDAPEGLEYTHFAQVALNQAIKLKVDFYLNGVKSDIVTNTNVKYTSSNTENIVIVSEEEGIIKAVGNKVNAGSNLSYSDITATLSTRYGTLSLVCRVFVNEYSTLDNLYVNYMSDNKEVLSKRDGSEVISLTKNAGSIDLYSYILNFSHEIKKDLSMHLESNNTNVFTVTQDHSREHLGIFGFALTPVNEGTAELKIITTCSNSVGKMIKLNINIVVDAGVGSVTPTASARHEVDDIEILNRDDLFSIKLDYFDTESNPIQYAKRQMYIENLPAELQRYIKKCGDNLYKVYDVPNSANKDTVFSINGYVYKNSDNTGDKVNFSYNFYIRNSLENIIVSTSPATELDSVVTLPSNGINEATLTLGTNTTLYAYSSSYYLTDTEPVTVNAVSKNTDIATVSKMGNVFTLVPVSEGVTSVDFVATDGVKTFIKTIEINVVGTLGTIKLYRNEICTDEIDLTQVYYTSDNPVKIYYKVVDANLSDNIIIEPNNTMEVNTSSPNVTKGNNGTTRFFEVSDFSNSVPTEIVFTCIRANCYVALKIQLITV